MSEGLAVVPEGPKREPKPGPKTELDKLREALEEVDRAVAELDLAVGVAEKFTVPGMDLRINLASKLEPVLSRIGYDMQPTKKTRGPRKG
jgi:hypothetical protein